jgi:hypothetical protein
VDEVVAAFGPPVAGDTRTTLCARDVRDHRSKGMTAAWLQAARVGSRFNRLLRAALGVLTLLLVLLVTSHLVTGYWPYVDIEIPLRAADRWLHGGAPYLASAFAAPPGYDLPFLYPPPFLPLVAPLLALPRPVVWAVWSGAGLATAVFACRRLGIPGRGIPLVLCWPPFAEAILGGNVQVFLFAAFVTVFFDRDARGKTIGIDEGQRALALARDPRTSNRPRVVDGLLAGIVPAFKLSQPHSWLALLRRRPGAAAAGLLVLGVVAGVSVPIFGIDLWRSWLEQLGRASDPGWPLAGFSLARGLPGVAQLAIALGTGLACLRVPIARLGAWTGLLTVLGGPSLRMFGLLFALPAFLVVRREIALVGAFLVATYTFEGVWMGVLLVTAAFALAERYPALREPTESPAGRRRLTPDAPSNLPA